MRNPTKRPRTKHLRKSLQSKGITTFIAAGSAVSHPEKFARVRNRATRRLALYANKKNKIYLLFQKTCIMYPRSPNFQFLYKDMDGRKGPYRAKPVSVSPKEARSGRRSCPSRPTRNATDEGGTEKTVCIHPVRKCRQPFSGNRASERCDAALAKIRRGRNGRHIVHTLDVIFAGFIMAGGCEAVRTSCFPAISVPAHARGLSATGRKTVF